MGKYSKEQEFLVYKKKSIKIAKELLYKPDVIEALQEAKTEFEVSLIMEDARRKMGE